MKPTPSKLVLLMSAAGLGLSWSGVALASRESNLSAGVATTFGAPPSAAPNCTLQSPVEWAECPAAQGELLRTIVADAAARPLSVSWAPVEPQHDTERSTDIGPADADSSKQAAVSDDPPADRQADALAAAASQDLTVALADTEVVDARPSPRASPKAAHSSSTTSVRKPARGPATDARAIESSSDALERVFATLVDVLGAQLDEPAPVIQARGATVSAAAASAFEMRAPSPAAETVPQTESLQRVRDAEQIVVAPSHTDKVLMSLAALRSPQRAPVDFLGTQTEETVVLSQSDKVLETLALFRAGKPKSHAWDCPAEPELDVEVALHPFSSSADADLLAGYGPGPDAGPDILLDLPAPVSSPMPRRRAAAMSEAAKTPVAAVRSERDGVGHGSVALSADRLDEVRGGFVTEGGLKISFGIERAVFLNGSLVATTTLNIADLSKISGGQAQVSAVGATGSLAVIQTGGGNLFAPGTISTTAAGTVIQNTLDNQKINTITRIDAVVNSLSILKSMSLESSMRSAIVNSLRR